MQGLLRLAAFVLLACVGFACGLAAPPVAEDASPLAVGTVAGMIVNGTKIERLWAAHLLAEAPPEVQRLLRRRVEALVKVSRAEKPQPAHPEARAARIRVRLRVLRVASGTLREMGIGLQALDRSSPPYPSPAEREAGAPYLSARLESSERQRLEAAIQEGLVQVVGTDACEGWNGETHTLTVLEAPPGFERRGNETGPPGGPPETGVVITFRAGVGGAAPSLVGIGLRRVVVALPPTGDTPGLRLLGSWHSLDPQWGIFLTLRDRGAVLLAPRHIISGACLPTDAALPLDGRVLEISVAVRPPPSPDAPLPVVPSTALGANDAAAATRVAERVPVRIEAILDDGRGCTFRLPESVCPRPFVGEHLVVVRGTGEGEEVATVEVGKVTRIRRGLAGHAAGEAAGHAKGDEAGFLVAGRAIGLLGKTPIRPADRVILLRWAAPHVR